MRERGNVLLKFLDKYLGIPVVFILGFFRKNNVLPNNFVPKCIGVLKTAAIGDTVLLSAILVDIKNAYPQTKIVFFTGHSNYEIARIIGEELSNIEVIKLPVKDPLKAVNIIRQYVFDLFFDFGPWPRINALLSYFSKSKCKVGFKTSGQYRHYVYDIVVEHRDNIHELENYRNIIRAIGCEAVNLPSLRRKGAGRQKKDIVVLHLFPGGSKKHLKQWSDKNWMDLIIYLSSKGKKIFLTGGKEDKEYACKIEYECKKEGINIEVVAGRFSLVETIELLSKATIVVSVDTGVMHIASALGCPIIALHGPTSYKRWGPLNDNSVSIQANIECSPCLNLGFEYRCNDNKCMRSISVGAVIEAVNFFLKRGYK